MPRHAQEFQTIRSEGGLLPPDLLRRILDPKEKLNGRNSADYGLPQSERLNDVITQSWNRLRKHWAEFRSAADGLPEGEAGTGLTNDKWSLPLLRELGFGLLPTSAGPEIGGRIYPINRFFGPVPIHLVGWRVNLDKRTPGVRGAAAANPHGLVQEFLNRCGAHDWGIVSNGLCLRILRDNQALSRQAFLEFDLESMFVGEVYSDFVLLWLIAHATRFAPRQGDCADTCWLENWTKTADEAGTRALLDLRGGVEKALQILGEGFTGHARNLRLRESLRTGKLTPADFHGQLLRVVYRLIFLFVAEDRVIDGQPLLHPRDPSDAASLARQRFAVHYGTRRLREMASKIKGSRHGDLWQQLQVIVGALSGHDGFASAREHLALPFLGSFLWSPASTTAVNDAELANHDFLETLRHLAFTRQDKVLRPVDYKNLGAEELGGVYESLLGLTPQISADGARFSFAEFAGNERKTSGSYYTPDSLVQCLLDSALDPVVEGAVMGKTGVDAEKAILDLKVCDPAVGSGHFLVGAAHRLARHLSRVRALAQGESEPSPLLYQHALREVIGHCLYGVDINSMAAELCRVSLWLEALEPGKPLSFLDHHIRVGNSLLVATPELIAEGIPDEAFTAIEGDDKKACAVLKKRNKVERKGWGRLFAQQDAEMQARLQQAAGALEKMPDDRPEDIRAKELAFRRHEQTEEYRLKKRLADAWSAAFVIRKCFVEPGRDATAIGVTQAHLNEIASGQPLLTELAAEIDRLSAQYQFFQWYLAFPEVFAKGGFDCVLGNPPWERVKIQEKEWFAERNPEIANAPNAAARQRMINVLTESDPCLYQRFLEDSRKAEGESHMMRHSGCYPLCGRGDINVYTVFAEAMRTLINESGRAGCVLPSGIATDDTTKFFFQDVVETKSLVSLFDFENKGVFFPGVHSSYKFCLFTVGRGRRPTADSAEFVFFAHRVEDLNDPDRRFTLSAADIALLNPNTRTCPIFRSRKEAELTKAIYRRVPVLIREARDGSPEVNPCGIRFSRMFDMSNDSHLFRTREQLESEGWCLSGNIFRKKGQDYLPLYEAKMTNLFDHRHGSITGANIADMSGVPAEATTVEQHEDAMHFALPRYWVRGEDVEARLSETGWKKQFLITTRDVARATDVRTAIQAVIPAVGVGHKAPLILPMNAKAGESAVFLSLLNAFVLDYVVRQKIGGASLSYFIIKQLPVKHDFAATLVPWSDSARSFRDWLVPRVLELTYSAWDIQSFAQDCGWPGPPFRWDEGRRFLLRCELDAAFFHLYLPGDRSEEWQSAEGERPQDLGLLKQSFLTPRDAVDYIMETFPIVKRKDIEKHGDYRTKLVILEIYDRMQRAITTGQPYETLLDPPPADPRCCHPEREV